MGWGRVLAHPNGGRIMCGPLSIVQVVLSCSCCLLVALLPRPEAQNGAHAMSGSNWFNWSKRCDCEIPTHLSHLS